VTGPEGTNSCAVVIELVPRREIGRTGRGGARGFGTIQDHGPQVKTIAVFRQDAVPLLIRRGALRVEAGRTVNAALVRILELRACVGPACTCDGGARAIHRLAIRALVSQSTSGQARWIGHGVSRDSVTKIASYGASLTSRHGGAIVRKARGDGHIVITHDGLALDGRALQLNICTSVPSTLELFGC